LDRGVDLVVIGSSVNIEEGEIEPSGTSGISRQGKEAIIEREIEEAKSGARYDGQQLQEMWDMEGVFAEEHNFELLEGRYCHPRKERFKVGNITLEGKVAKVRKCDLRHDRRMRHLLLNIIVKNGEVEANMEHLQPRGE
jgi:hypothetical protein